MDQAAARAAFELAMATSRPIFNEFFLARFFGMQIEYPEGRCVVTIKPRDFMFNPQGSLHGGVIATVMDISMGHLLNRVQGPGSTLEIKIQYVKAARGGRLQCTGEFTRQGQGISYLRSTLADSDGDVVAFATSTWKRIRSAVS